MVKRGDIWWADMGQPRGSEPGFLHPVLVVQADHFNQSNLHTVLVVMLTSNLRRAKFKWNVVIPASKSALPKDSVVNITQLVTLDRTYLIDHVGRLEGDLMHRVEDGLRLVLGLS
jgi:mRNA interferase MazF